MDKETQAILGRISSNIPRRLAQSISKLEIDTTEEQKALLALKDHNISPEKKKKLAKLLERGSFRRSKEVVDYKKIKELDDYHTRQIARARASGRLKDPMTDKFFASRMKRVENIRKGLIIPVKQKPYTPAELTKARQQLDPTINSKKNVYRH